MDNKLSEEIDGLIGMCAIMSLFDDANKRERESIVWRKFEEEITHSNRFFPHKNSIIDAVKFAQKHVVYSLVKGTEVYRARVIEKIDMLPSESQKLFEFRDFSHNIDEIIDTNGKLIEKYSKICFWGFDKNLSDAPPVEIASAGRNNPQGISYLYAAEDVDTSVVEARAIIGQTVSVATIRIEKCLRLFDFSVMPSFFTDDKEASDYSLAFSATARMFSTPNYRDDLGYIATQYISEMIKTQLGFDGIRFKSALNKDGINIVLFNTEKYEDIPKRKLCSNRDYSITSSSIYFVNGIKYDISKILPTAEVSPHALQ